MKVEVEIGDANPLEAQATKKHLEELSKILKPSGISKLMAMFTGTNKAIVMGWLKMNRVI